MKNLNYCRDDIIFNNLMSCLMVLFILVFCLYLFIDIIKLGFF